MKVVEFIYLWLSWLHVIGARLIPSPPPWNFTTPVSYAMPQPPLLMDNLKHLKTMDVMNPIDIPSLHTLLYMPIRSNLAQTFPTMQLP